MWPELKSHFGEQTGFGNDWLRPDGHEETRRRSKRVLGLARIETLLSEYCCLLIAQCTCNWDSFENAALNFAVNLRVRVGMRESLFNKEISRPQRIKTLE